MFKMKIKELYQEDQRHIKKWEKNYTDKEFYKLNRRIRKKLEKLLKKKKNLTGKEEFICSMIFHHGFNISSSKKALKHLDKAREKGYKRQLWLKAAIIDRLLQLQNKPQRYGTQITKLKFGGYKQYKLDGTINDKERILIGLPPLKKLKEYLEK